MTDSSDWVGKPDRSSKRPSLLEIVLGVCIILMPMHLPWVRAGQESKGGVQAPPNTFTCEGAITQNECDAMHPDDASGKGIEKAGGDGDSTKGQEARFPPPVRLM